MTYSLVLPVRDGGPLFAQCLQSVMALSPTPDEMIVVANGSTDGSASLAASTGAQVIERAQAVGPARARNLGAGAARGDVLVFIDADVTVAPDLIARIEAAFAADPTLAALIGSYDDAPAASNFFSQYKNLFHHYTHQTGNANASTFWGACGAIKRSVFEAVGGFDATFERPSVEDIELGYRLKAAGHRIALIKSIQVKHLKRYTAVSMVRSDFFDRALPWTPLLLRYGQLIDDLNLGYSARLSVILVFLLVGGLFMTPFWVGGLALVIGCVVGLLVLNQAVYAWFARARGTGFALRVIPWHWLYYAYSGLAFAIGWTRVHLRNEGRNDARNEGSRA